MRIVIETIPHKHQRYPTAGDWQIDEHTGDITIFVSQIGWDIYNFLVVMHELAEVIWCIRNGVSQAHVDKWDMYYENMREANPTNPQFQGEPGDNPMAPYHLGHRLGDLVERTVAFALNIDWQIYEAILDDLDNRYGRPAFRPEQTRASVESSSLQHENRDYGQRSTILRQTTEVPPAFLQTDGDQDEDKKGNEAPKQDSRIPRREDEDRPPVKIPPQSSKTGQGEGRD